MESGPIAVVREAYSAWNERREADYLASFHPDVVYLTSGTFPGFDPEYHGREGMASFRSEMLEAWEAFELEPLAITERDGLVIVELRFVAVGRESGVRVEVKFHHVASFEDGLVVRFAASPDLETALAAVAQQ